MVRNWGKWKIGVWQNDAMSDYSKPARYGYEASLNDRSFRMSNYITASSYDDAYAFVIKRLEELGDLYASVKESVWNQ